ncbi:MAG: hypothetical protein ACYC2H_04625 [Thermoplasmatota archaeon]
MRKADLVLAVLAVVAVAATAVAGLSGDRWTGERTYRFESHQESLPPSELSPAGGAGARFNWTVPDNATSANLTITLYYNGQAFRGGNAIVSVRITTPDGENQPPVTQSWVIPQGSTGEEMTLNASAVWDHMPRTLRDTSGHSHARTWTKPLVVLVTVEQPSDVPLANYEFTASVSGSVTVFRAA